MHEITPNYLAILRTFCEECKDSLVTTPEVVIALLDHIDKLNTQLTCSHLETTTINDEGYVTAQCGTCGAILWTGHSHIKD